MAASPGNGLGLMFSSVFCWVGCVPEMVLRKAPVFANLVPCTPWWLPHRLRKPSKNYSLTVWSDDWDPNAEQRPVAGRDFFLNEKCIHGSPHWLCFPDRKCFRSNSDYQSFRHSWILVERTYPVVPCPENTPLPNRKQSKQQRAKILSVYLRPWTLIAAEATDEKPYIADLVEVRSSSGLAVWAFVGLVIWFVGDRNCYGRFQKERCA